MNTFFIDDSFQDKPSRPGMGRLLGIGGISVNEHSVRPLEKEIEELCEEYGFPPFEPFKWSPKGDSWMHDNLVGEARQTFFIRILELAQKYTCTSVVVIEDKNCRKATRNAKNHEIDATHLFLERACNEFERVQCNGIIIVSQPSGNRKSENKFLTNCIETIKQGTEYVQLDRITLVLCASHKLYRLLQVADIVVSCTVSYVSGEDIHSPTIFHELKPLFASSLSRIGGVGLKIHPDYKYANLYHWLVGDTTFWKRGGGYPLPWPGMPYKNSANEI